MKVYLDNAATTALDTVVLDEMLPYLKEHFGNPSSIHSYGRTTRAAIEKSRKTIASILNTSPSEIFFTSGGTEANNMAIRCAVRDLGVKHIISSKAEHHCVLHTVEEMHKKNIHAHYVTLDEFGHIDFTDLESLLQKIKEPCLVSLMHANNETGTIMDIGRVGDLCKKYNAYFHSDTVQTVGHYHIDLQKINVHFISGAAHKFHGPKGTGFIYINDKSKLKPLIYGGAQERNMRAGTENVHGIVGIGKAMEIAYHHLENCKNQIQSLKYYFKAKLTETIPDVRFNGDTSNNSLYTVLNVSFPPNDKQELLLFNLDIAGIAASGGSACNSGSDAGSHVLKAIGADVSRKSIRFSFSKFNTNEEIDFVVEKLKELVPAVTSV